METQPFTSTDLKTASPTDCGTNQITTEKIIGALFRPNDLLCCGASKRIFKTQCHKDWQGHYENQQFIVPSPMSKLRGQTQDGKLSYRSLDNTGERRFLVIEFDQWTLDQQACLIWHLATCGPLTAVVHSGNKSAHAWFFCEGQSETFLRKFMGYAVTLGANPATWTRSQFVRMPSGLRDNGARQHLLYFNPALTGQTQ